MKKLYIVVIIILSVLFLSFVGYQVYDYNKKASLIDENMSESLNAAQNQYDEYKSQYDELKAKLDNANKNILYGFYYHKTLNKYVFKEIAVNKTDFNIHQIIKLLSQETSKNIINDYTNIAINTSSVNNNTLTLDLKISNWSSFNNDEKYRIIKSLAWSLYSSTNLEFIELYINGEPLYINDKNILDIYNRNYFNPINDNEIYAENAPDGLYFIPIISEYEDFKVIESNLTSNDTEMRGILDGIGEKYSEKIKTVNYEGEKSNGIVKININFEDTSTSLNNKKLINDLQLGYKLVVPFKHHLHFNNQKEPLFLNFTYHNNPSLNK